MSGNRDSTYQKHDLPRSLHGTEDADFVWNMITERFPNAAPLLCEMETVIDQAEDLLEQLKSSCRGKIETTISSCTEDSEESTALLSARESFFVEDDAREDDKGVKSVANKTQISQKSIFEKDSDSNSVSRDQESSESSAVHYSMAETNVNFTSAASSKFETFGSQTANIESESFNDFDNILDSGNQSELNESELERNDTDSVHRESNVEVLFHEVSTDDSMINSAFRRSAKHEALEKTPEDMIDIISLQGSGDENSSRMLGRRTPINILEEYAKRCNLSIHYEEIVDRPNRHKSNAYVIRGDLGGFSATSRGENKESAKNGVAVKILRMIAEQQINDEKQTAFADLSREEMLEIFRIGTEGERETNQRKLYKLCLEKGKSVPIYSVTKTKTHLGCNYAAKCVAMDFTGDGNGIRPIIAKKAAAEDLYQKYVQSSGPTKKV